MARVGNVETVYSMMHSGHKAMVHAAAAAAKGLSLEPVLRWIKGRIDKRIPSKTGGEVMPAGPFKVAWSSSVGLPNSEYPRELQSAVLAIFANKHKLVFIEAKPNSVTHVTRLPGKTFEQAKALRLAVAATNAVFTVFSGWRRY